MALFHSTAVESRTCLSEDNFTGLPYLGKLKLSTCHHDGFFSKSFRWMFHKNHKFINSFYVYCDDKEGFCDKYVQGYQGHLDEIASVSSSVIEEIKTENVH